MAPRKNPTGPAVSLAAIAFRKHPDLLRELRAAKTEPTLDNAVRMLSDMSGSSYGAMRAGALATLSKYIESSFSDPHMALVWLRARDRAMSVWCACACARVALPLTDKRREPRVAIETAEKWVRGTASVGYVRKAARASRLVGQNEVNDWEVQLSSNAAADAASSVYATLLSVPDSVEEAFVQQAENAAYVASQNDPDFDEAKSLAFIESVPSKVQAKLMAVVVKAITTFPSRI